jgi:hypothetical protein
MNGTRIEPLLSRDFATRVLETADRVVARGSQAHSAGGTYRVCV